MNDMDCGSPAAALARPALLAVQLQTIPALMQRIRSMLKDGSDHSLPGSRAAR